MLSINSNSDIQTMSVSLMTDCQKFEASSLTDIQSEIEALGVELEIEIITQKEYNDKILALSKLSSPQTTNTVSASTIGDAEISKLPDQNHVLHKSVDLHNSQMLTIKKTKGSASRHKHTSTSRSLPTSPLIDKKEQGVSDVNIMSLINANNEKMSVMEKQLEKLTTHCEKLETLLKQRETEVFPDIDVIQNKMTKLHRSCLPGTSRGANQILRRNYNDIIACNIRGIRYWSSLGGSVNGYVQAFQTTRTLFDYTTYEYVGRLCGCNIMVNPVYAVKYKDKYPEVFDICIRQTRNNLKHSGCENPWDIFRVDQEGGRELRDAILFASPAAIQVQLEEDYDLHIKTGVYSFKYESLQ